MSTARYAVYYVPPAESNIAQFGREWLGVDIETGTLHAQPAIEGLSKERLDALTASPKYYGFHGTLKPPFKLAANTSLESFLVATRLFAKSVSPIELPPLELAYIGKFLALSPVASSLPLELMAGGCVRALEGYRQHKTEKELAAYRQSKLTVHQEQMLEHWGYPYVLEEYRFHMTLTDRIDDEAERDVVIQAAAERCKAFLDQPLPVSELVVCTQPERDTYMRVVERIPFGRV